MKKTQYLETKTSTGTAKGKRGKRSLRVGFPRSLLYYKFHILWTVFFETLGAEVIVSPLTNKEIKDISVKSAPDEDCYSTKLYFGHVIYLKDKVDYFFIPRFSSDHKTDISCPKFIGLAEVLRSMFPDLPPILMPYYSKAKDGHGNIRLIIIAFSLGFKFTKNPFRILHSLTKSVRKYKQYNDNLHISEDELKRWENSELIFNTEISSKSEKQPFKIALVGHSYVINDPYASLNIKEMLLADNVEIITSEQLPRSVIEHQMSKLDFNM
ncbi:MAG: acyl-CoA dehydratase activase-related protein, partial [Candidatus Heimdallarchaeaceae archaeon]